MKNLKILPVLFTLAITNAVFLTSCEKEKQDAPESSGVIELRFQSTLLKNSITDVKTAIITILTSDDQSTKYTSTQISIQKMNGIYYTRKISLRTGSYKLIEFNLLDTLGNTIFATPNEGSELAPYVIDALPVCFTVEQNTLNSVDIEVLSTKNKTPQQFGLMQFPLIEAPVFGILIGVVDATSNQVIRATLNITSGNFSLQKNLDSTLTNLVLVRDGYANYLLSFSKTGYIPYSHSYSAELLKMYIDTLNNPLVIELLKEGAVSDIEGNIYRTVIIGNQVWMAENLRTTKYNDGTAIPEVTDQNSWMYATTPAYCWFNNDITYKKPYGALYNWYVVGTDKNVCPAGWHVPSIAELNTLVNYLGGQEIAGIKMKEAGFEHWNSPNTGATNESGFTSLGSGGRNNYGMFHSLGIYGVYWSTDAYAESPSDQAWAVRNESFSTAAYPGNHWKSAGLCIRCLKDE